MKYLSDGLLELLSIGLFPCIISFRQELQALSQNRSTDVRKFISSFFVLYSNKGFLCTVPNTNRQTQMIKKIYYIN